MDWISKKDLLKEMGISYGQLYRWKRERLIPEEWFIKQSSFTGQETVFPREEILARVRLILECKDRYSLEELARILSPEMAELFIPREDFLSLKEIVPAVGSAVADLDSRAAYTFLDLVWYATLSQVVQTHKLTEEQTSALVCKSAPVVPSLETAGLHCTIFSMGGSPHVAFSKSPSLLFDEEIQVLETRSLQEMADTLKGNYQACFSRWKKEEIESKPV